MSNHIDLKNINIFIRDSVDFDILNNLLKSIQQLNSSYPYRSIELNNVFLVNQHFKYKYSGKISKYKKDIESYFITIHKHKDVLNDFIELSNIRSNCMYYDSPEIKSNNLKIVNKIINNISQLHLSNFNPTENNILYINKLFDMNSSFRRSSNNNIIKIKDFELFYDFFDNTISFKNALFNGTIYIPTDKSELLNYPFFKLMYLISKTDPFEEAYVNYQLKLIKSM